MKQLFQQAVQQLRDAPLISLVSILGVAFSVAMLMVVVILYQIQTANFKPETKRNRMLYISLATEKNKKEDMSFTVALSSTFIKAILSNLGNVDMVSANTEDFSKQISLAGKDEYKKYAVMGTDAAFWTMFDFDFSAGRPYTEAEFESEMKVVVVTEDLARSLLGRRDVVGQTILIDFIPYTVVGVVKEVSKAASRVYAKVWTPYARDNNLVIGSLRANILAHSSSDFELIRLEIAENLKQYNTTLVDSEASIGGAPFAHFEETLPWKYRMDTKAYYKEKLLLILFLILLPVINLTGVNLSRIRKRYAEFGVRKAFGATKRQLFMQVLNENLVLTLLGGVLGLLLSFACTQLAKRYLLTSDTLITWDMLISPAVFVAALVFCFLINLLSTLIPAWKITKEQITEALSNN